MGGGGERRENTYIVFGEMRRKRREKVRRGKVEGGERGENTYIVFGEMRRRDERRDKKRESGEGGRREAREYIHSIWRNAKKRREVAGNQPGEGREGRGLGRGDWEEDIGERVERRE